MYSRSCTLWDNKTCTLNTKTCNTKKNVILQICNIISKNIILWYKIKQATKSAYIVTHVRIRHNSSKLTNFIKHNICLH